MKEEKEFNAKIFAMILIVVFVLIVVAIYFLLNKMFHSNVNANQSLATAPSEKVEEVEDVTKEAIPAETKTVVAENEYAVKDNHLSKFDLSFLKFENEKENKIYSPLSIKYAFKMLEEATTGKAYEQIAGIVEAYHLTEYESNENMALANAFFIRDTYKENIKESYINALKTKYNADIVFDDFSAAEKLNEWVKNHTLKLIPQLLQDEDVHELNFSLVNALGIDMEWEDMFIHRGEDGYFLDYEPIEFKHEKRIANPNTNEIESYQKSIDVHFEEDVVNYPFENLPNKVDGMHIEATINNYNIVDDLGEEYIKNIVSEEYRRFARNEEYDKEHAYGDFPLSEDTSDEGIQEALDEFLPRYIRELNENYHKVGTTTDYSIYVDDDVKIFEKDLKQYNGTVLQYIGIMPENENLDKFINKIDANEINSYISKLKTLDDENFKEGVVTRITGFIPKFDFEYELNLQEDLENMGVTEVFEQGKANLTKMTDDQNAYIGAVKHKATIEFTEDGIKAAAATMVGGLGGGDPFDYYFDVPVEDIDMTFDKPYLFLIRDKETGETWFIGTVYEPLKSEKE